MESDREWVYRSSLGRTYGVLAIVVGVGLVLVAVLSTPGSADPPKWFWALLGPVFLGSGVGALRNQVRVGPQGVEKVGAIRVRRIGWPEIERFHRAPVFGVLVLLASGESVALPMPSAVGRRRQQEHSIALCDQLEGLRHRYQDSPSASA